VERTPPPPTPAGDVPVLRLCAAVARGWMTGLDAAVQMRALLAPRATAPDLNRLSLIALDLVEGWVPRVAGSLLDADHRQRLAATPQPIPAERAAEHLAFLVCSCLQLVSLGEVRDGAKAIARVLDAGLPEWNADGSPRLGADGN